jgi:hypothetical protein
MVVRVRDPLAQTLDRLAGRLKALDIPYALMGGMAVRAHGVPHTTSNVDVLLSCNGLDRLRRHLKDAGLAEVPRRPRHFVDHHTGIPVVVRLSGHHPGWSGRGPIAFPDPTEASEEIETIRVLALPHLVQLKLAAGRFRDLAAVEALIRVHRLDESFLNHLHPAVQSGFRKCLDEIRRQQEFEEREG